LPVRHPLSQRVRAVFAQPWIRGTFGEGEARDLLLRGRFTQAAALLVRDQERAQEAAQWLETAQNLPQRLNDWIERAAAAYAQEPLAQTPGEKESAARAVAFLWRDGPAGPAELLLNGRMAGPRGAEVTYQLGLCKQEQAERLQGHHDMTAGSAGAADLENVQTAWQHALGWWVEYDTKYPNGADRAAVRRLRGRAEQALGDTAAARATWQNVSGPMTELEKVAALYRARQLPSK
jgi:hypothetical protein